MAREPTSVEATTAVETAASTTVEATAPTALAPATRLGEAGGGQSEHDDHDDRESCLVSLLYTYPTRSPAGCIHRQTNGGMSLSCHERTFVTLV
jgi:hypothetical protein